jgi:hypothetical protein
MNEKRSRPARRGPATLGQQQGRTMSVQRKRFVLLVDLCWELRECGCASVLACPARKEPSLQVLTSSAGRLEVRAELRASTWAFRWSDEQAGIDDAAKKIAALAEA